MNPLYIDDDFVVASKPAALSTHRAHADDTGFVELLSEQLECDLSVHQRLDKVTSGVMVFGRSKRAAKLLATQFQERQVEKSYRALVVGHPPAESGTLVDKLSFANGKAHLSADGKLAKTRWRLLSFVGPFSLLELHPLTGRAHQLRAQLAAWGAPILGDELYGGGSGTGRVLLHAHSLSFRSFKGERLHFTSPLPELLEQPSLKRLLEAILVHLKPDKYPEQARRLATPIASGLALLRVDAYGPHWALRHYEGEPPEKGRAHIPSWREKELRLLADLAMAEGAQSVHLLEHRRHQGQRAQQPKLLKGQPPVGRFPVKEHKLEFSISMTEGLGCGLYLDQVHGRDWIASLELSGEALNLFAYTCGLSVAAAAAGARRVTSVDLSKLALNWGKENFQLNGIPLEPHRFWADDALKVLARAARRAEDYQLVICDPPSFARRGRKTFSLKRDLKSLINACLQVLAPGGWLYFSINNRDLRCEDLIAAAKDAIGQAQVLETVLIEAGNGPLGVGTELKALLLQR